MAWLLIPILLLSCQSKDKSPTITFDKKEFAFQVEPPQFKFKSIKMDIAGREGKSINCELSNQELSYISLIDSVKSRITDINIKNSETLQYFIWIRLNTEKSYGYNLEYIYMNPKMSNGSSKQLLEPIKK
jgi:hypothetical protein